MSTKQTRPRLDRLWQYDRAMLRSAFVSAFWAAIEKRKRHGFTLQALATALGIDKSAVSRWFGNDPQPNWTIDTIADIAHVLNLEIEVRARDRDTNEVYVPSGVLYVPPSTSTDPSPMKFGFGEYTGGPKITAANDAPPSRPLSPHYELAAAE